MTTNEKSSSQATTVEALPASALYTHCDPAHFDFETTNDLDAQLPLIGQERAIAAVEFGIGIERDGYNLFVLGDLGAGRRTLVSHFLEKAAEKRPIPNDICYVENFKDHRKPKALSVDAGSGKVLQDDMHQLIRHLLSALPAAFESEEYQLQQHAITEESKESHEERLSEIQKEARAKGLDLLRTPTGYAFAPFKDGQVLSPDEVGRLSEEEQEKLAKIAEGLQEELLKVMRSLPRRMRSLQDRIHQLNRDVAHYAVADMIEELKDKHEKLPGVPEYLDEVREDIVDHVHLFLQNVSPGKEEQPQIVTQDQKAESFPRRYNVNVLVDNGDAERAPVVYEDNPTFANLMGRIEHVSRMGTLITDYNLIRPGALHRSNGGYLILDALKLLREPYAWEALKRTLHSQQIKVESPAETMGLMPTVSLQPMPTPGNLKVILVGDRRLYYMLDAYDPEFRKLFKVMVDLEDTLVRSEENQREFGRLLASIVKEESVRPVDRMGVGRMVEHGARLAEDAHRISTHRQHMTDLLHEADYLAGMEESKTITSRHIQRALDAQEYRSDRIRERMQENIQRESIYISTDGSEVGQINGLAVLQTGAFSFGKPNRITARVRLGKGQILDIERETDLGGPLHTKGVLIISGFLSGRYIDEFPLSLSASLVFEQSYGMVDGDSASVAELSALLSAISKVPIKQSFAVTGSINQHGQVQPIGGVNEKIEGFFDVCVQRGLTGDQGVLIPESNVKHLMLRKDVVKSVEKGDFAIYPVETIDEALEILTGMPAGYPGQDGHYPEGTVNAHVEEQLRAFAHARMRFGSTNGQGGQPA